MAINDCYSYYMLMLNNLNFLKQYCQISVTRTIKSLKSIMSTEQFFELTFSFLYYFDLVCPVAHCLFTAA